ncbi:MAG: hypothetical protein A2X86_14430 [Bdellovibrionales bacterium GWA2_49_15]|nr:MAG: hypothetical protein A2X86_14430 [Bdellovibrionales bacterium GWA2_49_15]HAZ13835.1 DUF2892 domain-containing protein [Bdellovibrionales bacterium]
MKNNLHPVERAVRIVLGAFLISLVFWGPESIWFLVGIFPLVTGLFNVCPVYSWIGFSSQKIENKQKRITE